VGGCGLATLGSQTTNEPPKGFEGSLIGQSSLGALLCCLMLGVLLLLELAALDVACVEFGKVIPLLGQIVQRKNRGHWADGHAGAAIDALHRIDVELRDFLEARTAIIVRCVLLRVDAIYGAGIDAGGVLYSDAGFGNDEGHGPPPIHSHYAFPKEDFKHAVAGSHSPGRYLAAIVSKMVPGRRETAEYS
jgi:hypothetical protein